MPKKWIYKYNDNIIEVQNEHKICLYANNKLLDSTSGIFSADLRGKLDSGEDIHAHIGGTFTVECKLSVNSFYLEPIKII